MKYWTSRFLSYGGRKHLIRSVLVEMHTYWAQKFQLPKVLSMVTSIGRNFLTNDNSKKAFGAWATMYQARSTGGLYILYFFIWNKTAFGKLLFAVSMKKDELWVIWVHNYHIKGRN